MISRKTAGMVVREPVPLSAHISGLKEPSNGMKKPFFISTSLNILKPGRPLHCLGLLNEVPEDNEGDRSTLFRLIRHKQQ